MGASLQPPSRPGPDPASSGGAGQGPRPAPTVWSSVRAFGLTLLASALVIGAFGLFRLGRQFPGATTTPALLVPFLLPVLALALEAGALVASSAVQLGLLLGVAKPWALRVRATLPLLALLALVVGVAELIPRGTEHPGAFANELVQTARSSCHEQSGSVPVPLLGLSVRCGAPSSITGSMPGARSVQLAMRELTFSDDLRRVEITGLDLVAARALRVHLQAGTARIAGLAPWSRSPLLSPLGRFAILTALGVALWLAAALLWRPLAAEPGPGSGSGSGKRWRRLLGALLLTVPGAVVAAAFISLDQDRAAPVRYAGAALLGTVTLWLLGLLARRLPQIFSYFRAF